MKFISTRGKSQVDSASYAISKGLADDGGLFVPEIFPSVKDKLKDMLSMSYAEMATFVLKQYLTEYNEQDLLNACEKAYGLFDDESTVPVVCVDEKTYILELFHGPTLAFKDVALTLLPYLLRTGSDNIGVKEDILILVATSGDTGKAALEGFKDQKGIKIMVFYPSEGVSDMQKAQMCTQEGSNVNVVGVNGNFDDCQTAVKKIFSSKEMAQKLKEKNVVLSSANSINFGRLAPQITYYFSAYADLVNTDQIKLGDKVNFVVPTGNFGNILAGYYAKQMGLPVDKLICASNDNNVLTEFLLSGTYDANREFFKTMSPSMDILISSNLERLIFEMSGRNANVTSERMEQLKKEGNYTISNEELEKIEKDFYGAFCSEEDCEETIAEFFDEYGYVLDTHTAVAVAVSNEYKSFNIDDNATVILSTASPYKFTQNVLKAITGKFEKDAFKASEKLERETAFPIPNQIIELKTKQKRFTTVINKGETEKAVLQFVSK